VISLVSYFLFYALGATRRSWAGKAQRVAEIRLICDMVRKHVYWNITNVLLMSSLFVFFTLRVEQFELPDAMQFIELGACGIYTIDLFLQTLYKCASTGHTDAFVFWRKNFVPWAFSCGSVAYRSFTGQTSHFSFQFIAIIRVSQLWRQWVELTPFSRLTIWDHYGMFAVELMAYVYIAANFVREVETLGGDEPNFFRGSEPAGGINASSTARWSLYSSVYFTFICTFKTGYGDLLPVSVAARVISYIGTVVSVGLLGKMLITILEIYDASGVARTEYPARNGQKHIVICGTPSLEVLSKFILEVYHDDYQAENEAMNAVILFLPAQRPVMDSMALLLKNDDRFVSIAARVTMVEGTALKAADLDRVRYKFASGAFLLPNIYSQQADKEDIGNTMRALCMKRHTSFVRIVMLAMEERTIDLLTAAGLSRNDVICSEDITQSILGKAAEVPGYATLVACMCKTASRFTAMDIMDRDDPWLEDYMQGLGFKVIEVPIPKSYYTVPFSQAAVDIAERSQYKAFLIGLTEEPMFPADKTNYVLFPNKLYRIGCQSDRTVKGIMIAKEVKDVKLATPGKPIKWNAATFQEEAVSRVEANNPRLASSKAGKLKEGWVRDFFVEQKDKQEYAKFKLAIAAKRRAALGLVNRAKMSRVHVEEALGDDNPLIFRLGEELEALVEDTSSELMQDPFERTLLVRQLKAKHEAEEERKELEAEVADDWDVGDLESLRLAQAQMHRMLETDEKQRLPDSNAIEEDNALWGAVAAPAEEPWASPKAPGEEVLMRGDHIILLHIENELPEVAGPVVEISKAMKRKPLRPGRLLPLRTFLRSLRAQRRKRALVVVSLRVPVDWADIQQEKGVFLVQGPPLDANVLLRAGLYQAKTVVIYGQDVAKCHYPMQVDSDAGFALRLLEALLLREDKAHIPVITHLQVQENTILLPETCAPPKQKDLVEMLEAQNNEEGEYDEPTDKIVEEPSQPKFLLQSRFACGLLASADSLVHLTANILYQNCLGSVISEMGKAAFFVLPVPESWKGLIFGELVEFMMRKRNVMPMGLLRKTNSQDTIDFLDSSLESRKIADPDEPPSELFKKVAVLAETMRRLLPKEEALRYQPGESAFKRYTVFMPLGHIPVLFNDGIICMMPTVRNTTMVDGEKLVPTDPLDGPPNFAPVAK